MSGLPRIEDLRRRVRLDPASIAFAQLAEECRRAGFYEEAVATCRAGLALHPGYVSARITLGRALSGLDRLDEALPELEAVLGEMPQHLGALREVARIHHRRGSLTDALARYRRALALAPNDPELNRVVLELSNEIGPVDSVDDIAVAADRNRSRRIVAELERLLQAIHVARASGGA